MSETPLEAPETSPEPAPDDAPEIPPEPSEGGGDGEEEEAAEEEQQQAEQQSPEEEQQPEEEAPQALTKEQLDKRDKALEKAFAAYTTKVEALYEEDAINLVPLELSPSAPYGFFHRNDV